MCLPDQRPAPRLRVNIGDGLRECPQMASGILRGVLPLSVRLVGWRRNDSSASFCGTFAVPVHVGNPHHHGVSWDFRLPGNFRAPGLSSDDHTPVPESELRAVISDPQPFGEAECAAKPLDGLAHIRVGEHWYDRARGHGTVRQHLVTGKDVAASALDQAESAFAILCVRGTGWTHNII